MMPMKPCDTTGPLFDMRAEIGPMQEDLNLTHGGLDDGHHELFFWRYAESDVKDDQ